MVGAINTPYRLTRYTFLLHPVIILLLTESMSRWAKLIAGNTRKSHGLLLAFISIYLIYSEDFSLYHMKNIDSKEVNSRMHYDLNMTEHYYLRMDYRTPAGIINEHLQDNNIVISTLGPTEYSLNRLDYFYLDYRAHDFLTITTCAGTRELWSNA